MLMLALLASVTVQVSLHLDQQPVRPDVPVVQLDDIIVVGRPVDDQIRDFISTVGNPVNRRSLARWNGPICAGVVNMEESVAEYLADRVSTVATDLGLEVSEPGCNPNIVILASDDGAATARTMVRDRRSLFHTGAPGTNRSFSDLERFQQGNQAVRWWAVSLPTDSRTGRPVVAFPGYYNPLVAGYPDRDTIGYAPVIVKDIPTRLSSQIRDDLTRIVIVVDVTKMANVSIGQLGDYISMVAMAQINPDADTSGFRSILNVFGGDSDVLELTGWDRAYLLGLYGLDDQRVNGGTHRDSIRRVIAAEVRRQGVSSELPQD